MSQIMACSVILWGVILMIYCTACFCRSQGEKLKDLPNWVWPGLIMWWLAAAFVVTSLLCTLLYPLLFLLGITK